MFEGSISSPIGSGGEDRAKKPGMSLAQLEDLLDDMRWQPSWRHDADVCAEFYDGNQRTPEEIARLEDRGLAPLTINLIKPTVDFVLGMEAKNRRDFRAVADDDAHTDIAEAMNERIHEMERMSNADAAISDAFKAQCVPGLGWVEISRETDPFKYPYRCRYVHRREIWWDWRGGLSPAMENCRWLLRRRWYDEDHLAEVFPKHADLIRAAVNGWMTMDSMDTTDSHMLLAREWGAARDTTILDLEWRDSARRRACVYELWYRTVHRGVVLRVSDGKSTMPRAVEFDEKNPVHVQALQDPRVELVRGVFSKTRLSWWVGPHRLMDVPSPLDWDGFPYVPFYGFLEDLTGVPYGMVRGQLDPQREFNARRSKMMWILSAKRVIADDDAVVNRDHETVMMEVARPDAYVRLNPARMNRGSEAFRVETDSNLAQQQFEVMADAAQRIQDVPGIYQEMLGQGRTAQSGTAIENLVEQGTTTLAELIDNYDQSRRQVGRCFMALAVADMAKQNNISIAVGDQYRRRRIVLNQIDDESQGAVRNNDILTARLNIIIEDTPSTPTYRAQMARESAEIIKSMPEELQPLVIDLWLESTNYKNREQMADRIRKATGQSSGKAPEDMSPAELAEMEQAQAAQQEKAALEQAMVELQMAEVQAKLEASKASAAKAQADVERASREIEIRMQDVEARFEDIAARERIERERREWEDRKAEAERELKLAIAEMSEQNKRYLAELQARAEEAQARVEERRAAEEERRFLAEQDLERDRMAAEAAREEREAKREAERQKADQDFQARMAKSDADREERQGQREERRAEREAAAVAKQQEAEPVDLTPVMNELKALRDLQTQRDQAEQSGGDSKAVMAALDDIKAQQADLAKRLDQKIADDDRLRKAVMNQIQTKGGPAAKAVANAVGGM